MFPLCMYSGTLKSKTCIHFLFLLHVCNGCRLIVLTYIHLAGLHRFLQNMFPCFCQSLKEYVMRTLNLSHLQYLWLTCRAPICFPAHSSLPVALPLTHLTRGSTNFLKTSGEKKLHHLSRFPKAAYIKVLVREIGTSFEEVQPQGIVRSWGKTF